MTKHDSPADRIAGSVELYRQGPDETRTTMNEELPTSGRRETALRQAHDEIESTKILANTTGIRWIVFSTPRYGWMRTDTPSPRWLPIDRTIAVVYPHPELHDKKRELAWEQSHPVAPYLPHCTEIVTEHKRVMDMGNGGIKPIAFSLSCM